jgi:RNA-directed DNA polymerase
MLLEQELEPVFHRDSYGYRPGRSAHDALAVCRRRCWTRDWVLDLDVRAFFDSVPHSLLLKAVAHHTGERWVLLYISRWLKAPMQMPDGTVIAREKGTPQGSPISPLLANLFMHYAFDTWMDREFPGCPFERYADDIVAHCDTEEQARQLRAAIAERLGTLGLELHPVKTKIVYCQDANRRGDFGHTSFDFLGYTFRGRLAKGRKGYFTGFSPAISGKAKKAKGKQIRDWHLNRRSSEDLSSLAKGDQSSGPGLDQLLRGLLPLRVVFPGMAHQRASRPVGHAQVQAIPRQVRQSDGLAAEGVSAPAGPVRPLAAHRVHLRPDCGGRMTGDRHVRS